MPHKGRRDDRSEEANHYRAWYRDTRWRGPHGVRTRQLRDHPLCAMCEAAGRVTVATVCDHVDPDSKKTEQGFFAGPFQSLCDADPWRCHSSVKQRQEIKGYVPGCDANGRPIDRSHPWNRSAPR